jgi:exopolysaccharide production protein ExoZ
MFFYAVFGALLFLPAGRLVTLVCVFVALVLIGHFFGPFDSAAARTYTDSHLLEFAGGSLIGSAWVKGLFQFPDIGRSRVLLAIGDASYSIYLTHLFTLGVLRVVWAKAFPESQLMFLVVGMPVCAIVGWMSYRWLETPLLHWLGGRSRPRLKPAPST